MKRALRFLSSFVSIGLILFVPVQATAFSDNQTRLFESNVHFYDIIEVTYPEETCTGDDQAAVGANNRETAYFYFRAHGLSPARSAGIVGNLMAESGENIDPNAANGDNYRGIAQWDTGSRWPRLVDWANARRRNPLDFMTQLDYLWEEATTRGNIEGFNAYPDDVPHAAWYWGRFFEVAIVNNSGSTTPLTNVQHLPRRTENAQQIFDQYGVNDTATGGTELCAGGSANIDGFYFPLVTTKALIRAGSSNASGRAVWCFDRMTNCHGSYNAADIHVEPGTVVIAATGGTVVSTREALGSPSNPSLGSNVIIKNNDPSDGRVYFYTHMTYESLLVTEGQQVEAGQPLGEVGAAFQANGTAPHLHFDMLPNTYQTRGGCARANITAVCRALIDVQPILVPLYDRLPE